MCVSVSPSPGSGMHAAAYFIGNRHVQRVNQHVIFDMQSGSLTSGHPTDILFIRYRLTSLLTSFGK